MRRLLSASLTSAHLTASSAYHLRCAALSLALIGQIECVVSCVFVDILRQRCAEVRARAFKVSNGNEERKARGCGMSNLVTSNIFDLWL